MAAEHLSSQALVKKTCRLKENALELDPRNNVLSLLDSFSSRLINEKVLFIVIQLLVLTTGGNLSLG